MRKWSSRALGLVVGAVLALGLVTACSSSNGEGTVTLVAPDGAPAAVTATTPQDQAIQASQAFYASSPVVVLTTAEGIEDGAKQAEDLGVPLLVAGGDEKALAAEIDRLGATHVLSLDGAAGDATTIGKATVVTGKGDLPKVNDADKQASTALLVTQEDKVDPFTALAGKVTGATVVAIPSGDPRTDPKAIETLHDLEPTRVVAAGAEFGNGEQAAGLVASAATGIQLPGGGQLVLPGKRYVALYGHPGAPALGVLGEQDLDGAVKLAKEYAAKYDAFSEEPVIPTFEIITTVATGGAGPDGDYSNETDPAVIEQWIKGAQEEDIYVLLDLQPGTDNFLDQAKQYESLLKYPNVGLALDPEWKLKPGQRHLRQIGQVDAAEINATTAWLAQLTRDNGLPQKMVVLHQFQNRMITHRDTLDTSHPELSIVIHADGHGTPSLKLETWNALRQNAPANVSWAWKNFIDEDTPTMTPEQTMQVKPAPVLVSYQ